MATRKPTPAYLSQRQDFNFEAGDEFLSSLSQQGGSAPAEPRGMARAVADTGLSLGRGAVQGVRMLTDLAGADNAVSGGLRSVEDYIASLKSAEAQADERTMAQILRDAEGKGLLDQVVAGFRAFGVAPVQTLAQAVGTSIPTVATALIPGAGPAAVAGRMGAALGIGAGQGAGAVKSSIYDEVLQAQLAAGKTPEEAQALAAQAQAYGGPNAGQIALGAGLGAWAGRSGIEAAADRLVRGTTQAAPGIARRVGIGAAAEGVPEALQGGQEKFATNTALANEGFDVDPMAGVVASGTMEALAGAAMGGALGIPRPAMRPGDQLRADKLPEVGPMSRAVNAAVEAAAKKADAGEPLPPEPMQDMGAPGAPTAEQPADPGQPAESSAPAAQRPAIDFERVLANMHALAAEEAQSMRQFGGAPAPAAPMGPVNVIGTEPVQRPAPDILNPKGEPFRNLRAAQKARAAQPDPGAFDVVPVDGGYVVRPTQGFITDGQADADAQPGALDGAAVPGDRGMAERSDDPAADAGDAPAAVDGAAAGGDADGVRPGDDPAPADAVTEPAAEQAAGNVTTPAEPEAPAAPPEGADVPTLKKAWSDAVQRGDTVLATQINDRIVAAKGKNAPAPRTEPEAPAEQAPAPAGVAGATAAPAAVPAAGSAAVEADGVDPRRATIIDAYKRAAEAKYPGRDTVRTAEMAADRLLPMIEAKNADGLIAMNLGSADMNPASRAAFEAVTGVKLPKGKAATERAIDEWAGVTEQERAAKDEARKTQREAENAKKDAEWARKSAAAVQVKDGDRTVDGGAWVDELFAKGFTKIVRRGPKTYLANEADSGWPLMNKDIAEYARRRAVIASAPAPATAGQPAQPQSGLPDEGAGASRPMVAPAPDSAEAVARAPTMPREQYDAAVLERPSVFAVGLAGDTMPMSFTQRKMAAERIPTRLKDRFDIVASGAGASRRYWVVPTHAEYLRRRGDAPTPETPTARRKRLQAEKGNGKPLPNLVAAYQKAKKAESDLADTTRDLGQLAKAVDMSTKARDALTAHIAAQPDDDFALSAKTRDGRQLIATASAQKPGQWQLTRFDTKGEPWGDSQYTSKAKVIDDFLREADLSTMQMGEPAATATTDATHKDPGQPAEPATPAVVREAIATAARNEDRPRSAMKAEALALIDAAMEKAPSAADNDDAIGIKEPITERGKKVITAVRRFGDDTIMVKAREGQDGKWEVVNDSYDGSGTGRKNGTRLGGLVGTPAIARTQLLDLLRRLQPDGTVSESDYVKIKVPGDGEFTVMNTRESLAEFRRKVEQSPGFKDRQPTTTSDRTGNYAVPFGVESGSGGKLAAFSNMVDEGDIQAALDYAEAVGIDPKTAKLSDVLRKRLDKWMRDQEMAAAVAEREAAPAPAVEQEPAPQPAAEEAAAPAEAADDDAPKFSRVSTKLEQQRDLVIQHNLTVENLLHAARMGGIPVPSLAVTKADAPMVNFGEITLIGSQQMADPKGYAGTKVFGADIYSPRYPSVELKLDNAAQRRFNALLAPFRQDGDRQMYAGEIRRPDDLTSYKPFKRWAADRYGVDENATTWQQLKESANALVREIGAGERIFQGFTYSGNRRYIDHTLDNVVKILKKELRGGENFNYGVGSLRAKFTPQFRSVEQIRKAKGRLVDKATFEAIKKEVNDEFLALSDDLGLSLEQTSEVIEDAAKMGAMRSLKRAFKDYRNDLDPTDEQAIAVGDFARKLEALPTEYFEAKILRAVDVAEFKVAVVPDDIPAEARKHLDSRGVKVVQYAKGDDADRAAKIRQSADENEVLFKRGTAAPGSLDIESARALAAQMAERGMVRLNVVQSVADMPARQRDKVLALDPAGQVRGAYFRQGDSIWMVADNIRGADEFVRIAFHEAFHRGLARTIPEAKAVLREMWRTNQNLRAATAAQMKAHGIGQDEAIEEALAVMAEAGTVRDLKGWGKLLETIRSWVAGFAKALGLEMTWTDDMVLDFVAALTGRGLQGGVHVNTGGDMAGAAASRQPRQAATDTPEFKRWFGDSKAVDAEGKPLVVYHGTPASFSVFEPDKNGLIFVTPKPEFAAKFAQRFAGQEPNGDTLMPLYASAQKPFDPLNASHRKALIDRLFEMTATYTMGDGQEALMLGGRRTLYTEPVLDYTMSNAEGNWSFLEQKPILDAIERLGFDAVYVVEDGVKNLAVFDSAQLKSAIGNSGAFNPEDPDIRFSRTAAALRDTIPEGVQQWLTDRTVSQRGFNRVWHRTVGTQLHKAKINKDFGRVYYAVQDFMKDVSRIATLAADKAPDMLPQIESLGDLARLAPTLASPAAYKQRKADIQAASAALFDGTLRYTRDEEGKAVKVEPDSDELGGIVWTDAELRERGLSDRAVKMYRQSRQAIDQSLENMLAADLYRQASVLAPEMLATTPGELDALLAGMRRAAASENPGQAYTLMRNAIKDRLAELETALDGQPNQHTPDLMARRQELRKLQTSIADKAQRIADLQDAGYAPLMRFGPYAVDAVNADGRRVFFGLYESQAAANKAARNFRGDGLKVTQSIMPQKDFEALQGVSPETALLFAEMLGVEKNEAMQAWLKNAVAEQSALKRHIRRKGIEGFDEDGGRVLAAFVTSNARAASRALHAARMADAVENVQQGDVKDEARALVEYVNNPKEEAQALRGLLFVQYIGGSIASAMVNLTQTLVQTLPYLSQYGGAIKAGARLSGAMKTALADKIADPALAKAVARAEKDGVIKPQEVFQLQAEASRSLGSNLYARSLLAAWGSMFQLAEQFNRRTAFIAAYETARQQGMADPFAFAENAVDETQSVFNKGNRPTWARGAVGSTLFTFKTFTIQYLEFLKRLATAGEPGSPERAQGRKAAALALLTLVMLSGMKGLPFADDADDLIDTVAQGLGYNWTTDAQRDKWLDALLGETFSDLVQHGFSGMPGVPFDVSQRLGMANLLPGTGLLKTSESNKQNQVLEVFGVAGSAVRDATQGQFLPVAIRNLMQGLDIYETGLYRDRRGRNVTEADMVDAVLKGIGLQPSNVARAQREIGRQIQQRSLYQAVKEELTDAMAQARFDGDDAALRNAQQALARWNDTNPEARIIILPQTIRQRVRQMRMSKAERTVANTPRPLRAQTAEALQ